MRSVDLVDRSHPAYNGSSNVLMMLIDARHVYKGRWSHLPLSRATRSNSNPTSGHKLLRRATSLAAAVLVLARESVSRTLVSSSNLIVATVSQQERKHAPTALTLVVL